MKNIIDVLYYSEDFVERTIREILSIHDLWSIRPLENPKKEFRSGNAQDMEKFSEFIYRHAEKDYPCNLIIHIGDSEKNYPTIMLNKTKKALKLSFDHMHPDYIGTPLVLPGFKTKY
jgi:hypothetical protein